jgi:hypothetical protein
VFENLSSHSILSSKISQCIFCIDRMKKISLLYEYSSEGLVFGMKMMSTRVLKKLEILLCKQIFTKVCKCTICC